MKGSVRGLTTAAGIWMVSTIGLAVGVGLYLLAVVATLLILFIMVQLERVEHQLDMGSESRIIRMAVNEIITDMAPYRRVLQAHNVVLHNVYVDYDYVHHLTHLNLVVIVKETTDFIRLFKELSDIHPTDSVSLSNQLS
jgi:putative Mg2+ transporter-C (MgtC) family protein